MGILQEISQYLRDYMGIPCYENRIPNNMDKEIYNMVITFDEDSNNTNDSCGTTTHGRMLSIYLEADLANDENVIDNKIKTIRFLLESLPRQNFENHIFSVPPNQIKSSSMGSNETTNTKVYRVVFYMEYEEQIRR